VKLDFIKFQKDKELKAKPMKQSKNNKQKYPDEKFYFFISSH